MSPGSPMYDLPKAATILAILTLLAPAAAAPTLSIEGLPATVTPGQTFTFDIRLVGAVNLDSYQITVGLTAPGPLDRFGFVVPDPFAPPASGYVGPATGFFFASTVPDAGGTGYELAITDSGLGGVTTVAGVSDRVYTATVRTDADLSGPLQFRLLADPSSLFLLQPLTDPDTDPAPVQGFADTQAAVANLPPTTLGATQGPDGLPIPAPASVWVLSGVLLALARRVGRQG